MPIPSVSAKVAAVTTVTHARGARVRSATPQCKEYNSSGQLDRFELSTAAYEEALELVSELPHDPAPIDPEEVGEVGEAEEEFRTFDPRACGVCGGVGGREQCTHNPYYSSAHSWELTAGVGRPSGSLRKRPGTGAM